MLNAPATGEAMGELIMDGAARVDLATFAPGRLPPLDPARLRGRPQDKHGEQIKLNGRGLSR